MWRIRRKSRPEKVDFTSLDRLAEIVEHVVDLIEQPPAAAEPDRVPAEAQVVVLQEAEPSTAVVEPEPEVEVEVEQEAEPKPRPRLQAAWPEPRLRPVDRAPAPSGHVLVLADPAGYRLVQRDGDLPSRRDDVELDGVRYRVLRYGASPLPDDRRRCAFLERQDPAAAERTPRE